MLVSSCAVPLHASPISQYVPLSWTVAASVAVWRPSEQAAHVRPVFRFSYNCPYLLP
jgi:hypothetical protein